MTSCTKNILHGLHDNCFTEGSFSVLDIISLYEDLKKYLIIDNYDDLFYEAPEGQAQIDIIKEVLREIELRLN